MTAVVDPRFFFFQGGMGKDTWCEVMAKNKKGRKVEIFFWCCLPRPALLISRWAPINSWAFFFGGCPAVVRHTMHKNSRWWFQSYWML